MMRKLAAPGYRVAPMYCDLPNGTIIGIVDDLNVMVAWDTLDPSFRYGIDLLRDAKWHSHPSKQPPNVQKEQIKCLRKGSDATVKQPSTEGHIYNGVSAKWSPAPDCFCEGCTKHYQSDAATEPKLICPKCGADRYKQPCGWSHIDCPMHGTTSDASVKS